VKLELTSQAIEELKFYQRQTDDKSVYAKETCILMLSKSLSPDAVSQFLGTSVSCVYRYCKAYSNVGLSDFLATNYQGYWGQLSSVEISILRTELKSNIYTDAKSVSVWITVIEPCRNMDTFAVQYTVEGTVDLLNRIGFTYKKTKEVPCECSAEKQVSFVKELSEILKKRDKKEEKSVIYYADGVHPTHNSRSTYAWIEKGTDLEQPTVSGRDRVNINGLLNAKDVTDVLSLDCDSINAQSTKELYQLVLDKNPDAEKIYIISDNAKYYKNKELTEWIKRTKIIQVFLPPYSPNLNLIERLWKFLRKKVINTEFYRTKEIFREAVNKFFKNIAQYRKELETLLTLKFRLTNSQSISL
jgi:transposase